MVDTVTTAVRSRMMSRVRFKDTKPEMFLRRMLHKAGYRYRLHVSSLPGKPDMVFVARKKVIFIHGCFWHLHEGCKRASLPKSNTAFWATKLGANKERDTTHVLALQSQGWDVLTVWECQLGDPGLMSKLVTFLNKKAE